MKLSTSHPHYPINFVLRGVGGQNFHKMSVTKFGLVTKTQAAGLRHFLILSEYLAGEINSPTPLIVKGVGTNRNTCRPMSKNLHVKKFKIPKSNVLASISGLEINWLSKTTALKGGT